MMNQTFVGLKNLNNTCFLNVVVQLFKLDEALGRILDYGLRFNRFQTTTLTHSLAKLFESMDNLIEETDSFSIADHKEAVDEQLRKFVDCFYQSSISHLFVRGQQADSMECFENVLNCIRTELRESRFNADEDGPMNELITLWYGHYSLELAKDRICGNNMAHVKITNFDNEFLRVQSTIHMSSALNAYFRREHVARCFCQTRDPNTNRIMHSRQCNAYFCDKCSDFVPSSIETFVYRAPKKLLIQIKLFETRLITQPSGRMDATTIKSSYCLRVQSELELNRNWYLRPTEADKYRLKAVIFHDGSSPNSGHYTGNI